MHACYKMNMKYDFLLSCSAGHRTLTMTGQTQASAAEQQWFLSSSTCTGFSLLVWSGLVCGKHLCCILRTNVSTELADKTLWCIFSRSSQHNHLPDTIVFIRGLHCSRDMWVSCAALRPCHHDCMCFSVIQNCISRCSDAVAQKLNLAC